MVPQGITNFGNSCFLNSVLQVLSNIDGLQTVLASWLPSDCHMSLTKCLLNLNKNSDRENVSVWHLLNDLPRVYKMPRQAHQQCDAEECLTQLLHGIEQEFGCDVLDNIFGGLMKQKRICPSCMQTSFASPARFNILPLSMTHNMSSLHSMIEEFQQGERLEEAMHCGKCGNDVLGATIFDEVVKWPETIILQLKRFASTSVNAIKEFHEVVDFDEEMLFGDVLYQLRSVVVHDGRSADSGHYFAYVRKENRWFRVSDKSVRFVRFSEVKTCAGYLFVYERVIRGDDLNGMDSHLVGVSMHGEHVVLTEGVTDALFVRPPTYHLPEPSSVLNEPLLPIDYWQTGSQLLSNHHISAALMILMQECDSHESKSTPRHPSFVAPISVPNFLRVVQQASGMIRAGRVPDPPRPRRIDDPHLKCLIAAAHGTMNPSFVIGDDIHWRIICMDATRRVIYTLDPYGTRNGFPHAISQAVVDAFEPYGKWKVQNSRVPLQHGNDVVNCGVWAIYTTLAWEDFLANLENTTRRECDFTSFLRERSRPRAALLRARYLKKMKQIRGTRIEAPIMEDLDNSDVEMIVMNRGTGERGTDPIVEGDAEVPNDVPRELAYSGLDEDDGSRDDNAMGMISKSVQVGARMHAIEHTKSMSKFRLSQERFMELFYMFNDVDRTPKSVAYAIHDHLGNPPGLKTGNIQAKVYKARKNQESKKTRSSRGDSEADATIQGDVNVPTNAPEESMDTPLKWNGAYRDGKHEAIDITRVDVEMHGIEPYNIHLQNEGGEISTGTQSVSSCDEMMADAMNVNNSDVEVPKFRLSQKEFMKLFDKYNNDHKTPKHVAHAIHDHLGNPPTLKIVNIQARIYKERKARNVKGLPKKVKKERTSRAKMAKKFEEMFVKYSGNKNNVMAVARAMHLELKSPVDITVQCLRNRIYKARNSVNAHCELARDRIEVNAKVKELYGMFSEQKLSNEEIAISVHREMEPNFAITIQQVKEILGNKCKKDRGIHGSDDDSLFEPSDDDAICEGQQYKHSPNHIRRSFAIKAQVLATEMAFIELPEHPCSSCKTLCFKASLQCISEKVLSQVREEIIRVLKYDKENNLINQFCSMCTKSLKQKEVPIYCALNGPCFVDVPEFIKQLNPLEARLVAPKLAFGSIYQLPKGGQFGLKGGMVSVAADMSKIQTYLPRTFDECAALNCDLKRRLAFKNAYMSSLIRPNLVMQSLNWLKDQPLYKGIGVKVRKEWQFMTQGHGEQIDQEDDELNRAIRSGIALEQSNEGGWDDDAADEPLDDEVDEEAVVRKEGLYREEKHVMSENSEGVNSGMTSEICNAEEDRDSFIQEDVEYEGYQSDDIDYDDANGNCLYDNLDTYIGEDVTPEQAKDPKYNLGDYYIPPEDASNLTCEELRSCTLNIAPGEGMPPKGLNIVAYTEELTHPHIFGGQPRREEDQAHLPKMRVRREMTNEDRRAAKDVNYMFFQVRKLQQLQVQSEAYISMRKGTRGTISAGTAKTDDGRESILRDDNGYRELANLRGTPHALLKLKSDVYAMMRQKGPPTLFLTFSAADSHWTDMLVMLYRNQHGTDISIEEVAKLPWETKCALIRSDPVSVARYYEHRMRNFFENMVVNCPELLGNVTDYVWVEEFQKRGTPHRHALVWIEGAPRYKVSSDAEYIAFFEKIICCQYDMLSPEFQRIQRHMCSLKYCIRCHGFLCRFGCPWFPIDFAIILRPHEEPVTSEEKLTLKKNKANFNMIREKLADIDDQLSKFEAQQMRKSKGTMEMDGSTLENVDLIGNESKSDQLLNMTFEEFLETCGLSRDEYIEALRTSVKREVILFKREIRDRRINNFNKILLETNRANMDIQPVLNPYAAVMYLTSYILKGEEGMSLLLKGVCEASARGGETVRDRIRNLGRAYLNASELSAQQAAFLLVGLSLHRSSLVTKFVPCVPQHSRTGILKKKSSLALQPEDSTDIMEKSMIDYFLIFHGQRRADPDLCLADFCCEYQMLSPNKLSKKQKQNSLNMQSMDEDEDVDDGDQFVDECLYVIMPTPSWTSATMEPHIRVFQKRKRTCVMRCPPTKKGTEDYYRQMLMLFLPGSMWCHGVEECDFEGEDTEGIALMGGKKSFCHAYESNLSLILPTQRKYVFDESIDYEEMEKVVLQDLAIARERIEEFNAEGQALPTDGANVTASANSKAMPTRADSNVGDVAVFSYQPAKMKTEDFLNSVDTLTATQRGIYDHIMHAIEHGCDAFHILLTGGAGVGKSLTLRCITQGIIRSYDRQLGFVDKAKVIVMAYTAKAAFNVSGDTFHYTLGIGQENIMGGMSESSKATKRFEYIQVQVIIIDEISLTSARMLHAIHKRCTEIFGTCPEVPFGGKHVLVVGDLFQLPPVQGGYCFQRPTERAHNISQLQVIGTPFFWRKFSIFELKQIMRQKDEKFAQILNRIREGIHTNEDLEFFEDIAKTRSAPPPTVPRMFFTNRDVDACNNEILQSIPGPEYVSHAQDTIDGPLTEIGRREAQVRLDGMPPKDTNKALKVLRLKIGVCVEVFANYDKADGLTNGADGHVRAVTPDESGEGIKIVWVEFTDDRIGVRTRDTHRNLADESIQASWTPVFKRIETFKLSAGKGRKGEVKAHRYQFPLKPATARTFHSSQGTSMDAVCMDLSNAKGKAGMHYTALSRVRTAEGLYFQKSPYQAAKKALTKEGISAFAGQYITTSETVVTEMERMRTHCQLSLVPEPLPPRNDEDTGTFTMTFNNVSTLRRNFHHIAACPNVLASDVVIMQETRTFVMESQKFCIPGYKVLECVTALNTSSRGEDVLPFNGSIMLCTDALRPHASCMVLPSTCPDGIEVIHAKFPLCHVVSVYKRPSVSVSSLIDYLSEVLAYRTLRESPPLVILGDFNVDLLSKRHTLATDALVSFMESHCLHQIVATATTINGSLIDHVWTNIAQCEARQFVAPHSDHSYISFRMTTH